MPKTVEVPSTLDGHAADIWRKTFLSSYDTTCEKRKDRDACAAKIAWSAVKNKYKKKGDQWVKKAGDPTIGPISDVPEVGGPILGEVDPNEMRGSRVQQWRMAYLKALRGPCLNEDDPIACARAKANAAVGKLEEKDMDRAMVKNTSVTDKYVERTKAREQANQFDAGLIERMGSRTIVRPDRFSNHEWNRMPPSQKTVAAEARRRIIQRNYEQAVDDAHMGGWTSSINRFAPDEHIFAKHIETEVGALLIRAVLVRPESELTWSLMEMSRFASGTIAAKVPHGLVRHTSRG